MPKRLKARPPHDESEEYRIRKIARSHHAPADCILHARMVVESWTGKSPKEIAAILHVYPQTVRIHLTRFNDLGIDGLGMRSGPGRKPRLTEQERHTIIALVVKPPPGRLLRVEEKTPDGTNQPTQAQWSLDALTEAAHAAGIQVGRSQIRRILLREGIHWRDASSWQTHREKYLTPKGPQSRYWPPKYAQKRRPSV